MKKLILISGLMLSSFTFAAIPNIIIDGTVQSQIIIHPQKSGNNLSNHNINESDTFAAKKDIKLLHVVLSPQAKAYLADSVSKQFKQPTKCNTDKNVQLGMNIVPVFDQGGHGSCVTFATTAAIDAAYGRGDYISQLCNLELGTYLHQQDASYPSGWDGSYNDVVLDQIRKYGVISMLSQLFYGCSGKHIYPTGEYTSNPLPVSEFTERSYKILDDFSTKSIMSLDKAFSTQRSSDNLLENVKSSIKSGNRVIIASLLDTRVGNSGAQGKYGWFVDSWVITPEIEQDARFGLIDAAHALVVTGFDDKATITGPDNSTHRGVITLRNSWGLFAGNFGTYYMSYDYFKAFVFDAIEVKQND